MENTSDGPIIVAFVHAPEALQILEAACESESAVASRAKVSSAFEGNERKVTAPTTWSPKLYSE